jgi:hypothetical protein
VGRGQSIWAGSRLRVGDQDYRLELRQKKRSVANAYAKCGEKKYEECDLRVQ